MISIDTNILVHAFDINSPLNSKAEAWLRMIRFREDVAISEFVLAEFYGILRNPKILDQPLSPVEAVEVIQMYRRHPRWRLVGFPNESRSLHDELWNLAQTKGLAFRRLYDLRTALSLRFHGVTDFATINLKDFRGVGFRRVWNPLADDEGSGGDDSR